MTETTKTGFEKAIHKEAIARYEEEMKQLALSFKKLNFDSLKFNKILGHGYDTLEQDKRSVADCFNCGIYGGFDETTFERLLETNFDNYQDFKKDRINAIEERLVNQLAEQFKLNQEKKEKNDGSK